MHTMIVFALVVFASVAKAGQDSGGREVRVVPIVDLKRYMGTWYEVARLPNSFQNKCISDVTATYSLLDDGAIQVVNRCKKENGEFSEATGRAKRADEDGPNTKLKVRFAPAFLSFLPFVWGDYWIIDLAPDYSYAVIGDPDRKYLWVLSRTPAIDERTLQEVLDRVKKQGYDLTKLMRTSHSGK